MPKESRIHYNPSLTIEENAKNNGVSVDGIRYYIKSRGIDRNYERKVNTVEAIRKCIKKHPKATKAEVAKKTKLGINTISKYWDAANGKEEIKPTNFGREKQPKKKLRELNDYYATHPSCTSDILREEKFHSEILEPFCGGGSMSEVIKHQGYNVTSYDIVDRGYGDVGDFFEEDFEKGKYDIISNPPYQEDLCKVVNRCLEICKNKVALLFPIRYLSGRERYNEIYKQHPPVRVYAYQERICIAKNGQFDKYEKGQNLEIYAWYVWEKGYKGKTELRWIHNDTRPIYKEGDFDEVKILGDVVFHPNEKCNYPLNDCLQFHSKAAPENQVLSNHYDCIIKFRGVEFYGVEQLFHALQFSDSPEAIRDIMAETNGTKAKSLCNKIIPEKRNWNWQQTRYRHIAICHLFKYLSFKPFRDRLRETFPEDLVECPNGNDRHFACVQDLNTNIFEGNNCSGRSEMIVREMMMRLENEAVEEEQKNLGRKLTAEEVEAAYQKVYASVREKMENDPVTIEDSQPVIDAIERYGISKERPRHPVYEPPIDKDKDSKCLLLDFDNTLLDTSPTSELRQAKGQKDWDAIYSKLPECHLYDGWEEVFAWIREQHIKVGIISEAKAELVERACAAFHIPYDTVVGYMQFYEKPNPLLVNFVLQKLNVTEENCIAIGDSPLDEKMYRGAKIKFYGAVWDSQTKDELGSRTIETPRGIISIMSGIK